MLECGERHLNISNVNNETVSFLFVHWFIRSKHHEFSHVPISKDTCSFNISDNRTIHYINNDFTYLPLSPMKRNPTIIYSHSERDSMVNVNLWATNNVTSRTKYSSQSIVINLLILIQLLLSAKIIFNEMSDKLITCIIFW